MPNFDKRIALIVTLLFCMPSNLSAQIVLHGGLISVPSMTMEDFNSQKMFYNPGEDTWEMADYRKSFKRIHDFELVIGAIHLGGVLPEIGIVFEFLAFSNSLKVSLRNEIKYFGPLLRVKLINAS